MITGNSKKITFILIGFMFLIFLILILPSITAGCCFDSGLGTCTDSSAEASCTTLGGEFFGGSCNAVDVCQEGCCVLGTNTEYSNSGRCTIRSRNLGFEINFMAGVSREECSAGASASDKGACVSGDVKPYDCTITTQVQCPTNFYAGLSCTAPELNTTCTKTGNSVCSEEKLYSKDSCGNPDKVLDDCNYDSGKICNTLSLDKAECKNLNCADGKKNGERWCVDLSGKGGVGIKTAGQLGDVEEGWDAITRPPVGSRYVTQYCLNGEIITEGCADFRADTCGAGESGGASCEANPWQQCLAANKAEVDKFSKSKVDEKSCGSGSCSVWNIDSSCGTPQSYTVEGYTLTGNGCVDIGTGQEQMMKDLHLELCIPNTKGGFQFYPPESSSSTDGETSSQTSGTNPQTGQTTAESICSLGTYEAEIKFKRFCKLYPPPRDSQDWCEWYLVTEASDGYGYAGLLWLDEGNKWRAPSGGDTKLYGDVKNRPVGIPHSANMDSTTSDAGAVYAGSWTEMQVNGDVVKALKKRCKAISDCAAEWNWAGKNVGSTDVWGTGLKTLDPEVGLFTMPCEKTGDEEVTCYYKLDCVPWEAPGGSEDCAKCGSDGLPCSEYRCKALGDGCSFKTADGVGHCVSSGDKAAPVIELKSITPPSPIPPYSAVQIEISTNKLAQCKFNVGNAAGKYEEMKYDFGNGYTTSHTTTLYVPGQKAAKSKNATQYSIISDDGNYSLYVRCKDVSGNWNLDAKQIQFEVMLTPETTILDPKSFNPVSGSKIIFNTTEKSISFRTDEPVECKWGEEDKNFSEMENSFNCNSEVTAGGIINGYGCNGILNNITLNLELQSKYYIRCKDHPEYANETILINNVSYSKNTMDHSVAYILKPSEKLSIARISPSGQIIMGAANISLQIEVATTGGVFDGKSICYWKHSNETSAFGVGYYKFSNTDSFEHSQTITNPSVGNNFIEVRCEDSIGNAEYSNATFNLQIDTIPPSLLRLYSTENTDQPDKLIIKTIEDAICYFSFDKAQKCAFSYINATQMDGAEKMHTAGWKYDTTYYIKCQDYRGNENIGNCAALIRTY